MRTLFILAVLIGLILESPGFTATLSLEALREELSWGPVDPCDKKPIPGKDGHPLTDDKLKFQDYREATPFLEALASYVYSFDSQYLSGAVSILKKSEEPDLHSIFVMNALAPYLKGLGYPELKRRYVDVALENLTCLNERFQIKDLKALKGIPSFQLLALQMLGKSLQSAIPVMSESQKGESANWIRFVGDLLAQGVTVDSLSKLKTKRSALEKFLLELSPNPFLRSRSATDLSLVGFLAAE